MKSRVPAFTLVELMASIVIFTAILATLLSSISAVREAERFRDENVALTQAASLGFEPIIRSLRQANAFITVTGPNNTCVTVRGFYIMENGQLKTTFTSSNAGVSNYTLVTVAAEPTYGSQSGATMQWVKREYSVTANAAQLLEVSSVANPAYAWPTPLDECHHVGLIWNSKASEKRLTSVGLKASLFPLRLVAPVFTLEPGNQIPSLQANSTAPFVTLGLTVENPHGRNAPPVSLQTTITPTFSYGDQRE